MTVFFGVVAFVLGMALANRARNWPTALGYATVALAALALAAIGAAR